MTKAKLNKQEEVRKMLGIATRQKSLGFAAQKNNKKITILNVEKMNKEWKKWETRSKKNIF